MCQKCTDKSILYVTICAALRSGVVFVNINYRFTEDSSTPSNAMKLIGIRIRIGWLEVILIGRQQLYRPSMEGYLN